MFFRHPPLHPLPSREGNIRNEVMNRMSKIDLSKIAEKVEKGIQRGRKLTAKGRKLLDNAARDVKKG